MQAETSDAAMATLIESIPALSGLTFPLSQSALEQLVQEIKTKKNLPRPPRVEIPRFPSNMPAITRHKNIQNFIDSFQYNYTGENFFNVKGVRQNQSLFRVMEVAKRVIREALPIKCVEAVYLGIFLTQSMHDVERVPVIFNSEIGGHKYGHIIVLLRYNGKLGAVGLSRRADLMFKAWGFEDLESIILDYKKSYEKWSHKLCKIKIGTPIPHEGSNGVSQVVDWSNTVIPLHNKPWQEISALLHKRGRILGWESREVKPPSVKLKRENSSNKDGLTEGKGSKDGAHEGKGSKKVKSKPEAVVNNSPKETEGTAKATDSTPNETDNTTKETEMVTKEVEVAKEGEDGMELEDDDYDKADTQEAPRPAFLGV